MIQLTLPLSLASSLQSVSTHSAFVSAHSNLSQLALCSSHSNLSQLALCSSHSKSVNSLCVRPHQFTQICLNSLCVCPSAHGPLNLHSSVAVRDAQHSFKLINSFSFQNDAGFFLIQIGRWTDSIQRSTSGIYRATWD